MMNTYNRIELDPEIYYSLEEAKENYPNPTVPIRVQIDVMEQSLVEYTIYPDNYIPEHGCDVVSLEKLAKQLMYENAVANFRRRKDDQ
jgi:hypothetical protein